MQYCSLSSVFGLFVCLCVVLFRHVEHLVLHAPKPLMAKFKANQYAMSGEDQTALEFTEIP